MLIRMIATGLCTLACLAPPATAQKERQDEPCHLPEAGRPEADISPVPCTAVFPDDTGRDAFILATWPNGLVPYEFDDNVTQVNRGRVFNMMRLIMDVCRVRFVPRTNETDYVHIMDSDRNSATLGYSGGQQFVRITSWGATYIIVHELIHTLGGQHEHQRPGRDKFVEIHPNNIDPDFLFAFSVRPSAVPEGPYDFDSVMHYGAFAFSTNGEPTITVRPQYEDRQDDIGQRSRLSDGDILGLQERYGVPITSDLTNDGRVNGVDLSILIAAWDTDNIDLDNDGVCAASDLAYLLSEWTD